jgi:excisionase family DNA binding protein
MGTKRSTRQEPVRGSQALTAQTAESPVTGADQSKRAFRGIVLGAPLSHPASDAKGSKPRIGAIPMATKPIQQSRHPDRSPGRRYASLKEAATYMGVSPRTCRQWIAEGRINGYRINARLIRVDLNELDAAMQPFGGAV